MDYVHRLLRGELDTDMLRTDPTIERQQYRDIVVLALYELEFRAERRMSRSGPQRKAMSLLRSFLTETQRRNLRSSKCFLAQGSNGGIYRLTPRMGTTQRVEKHRNRWYVTFSFCLHDDAAAAADGKRVPPADLSLQHLLLLSADEDAFLTKANITARDLMWNGDWHRRLRAARQERLAQPA